MSDMERRYINAGLELRADERGKKKMVGYAAKYNQRSVDLGGFVEILAPGAFDRAIRESHDVRALVDHDPSKILGRTKAGTLALRTDETGLQVEVDMPDTQAARDLQVSIERGDVSGMSFGFYVVKDEWKTDDKQPTRIVQDLELFDVSAVTYPAYPQTEVSMRALEHAKQMSLDLATVATLTYTVPGGGTRTESHEIRWTEGSVKGLVLGAPEPEPEPEPEEDPIPAARLARQIGWWERA